MFKFKAAFRIMETYHKIPFGIVPHIFDTEYCYCPSLMNHHLKRVGFGNVEVCVWNCDSSIGSIEVNHAIHYARCELG